MKAAVALVLYMHLLISVSLVSVVLFPEYVRAALALGKCTLLPRALRHQELFYCLLLFFQIYISVNLGFEWLQASLCWMELRHTMLEPQTAAHMKGTAVVYQDLTPL